MDSTNERKIKVSVIIPVYNTEAYLRQCLDSIKKQTLEEIEVLCVDDGSTDTSVEIIREYEEADERFRLIQQENAGGGAARNRGILEARGEYLSFLDSDDFFEPTMLEKMSQKLDETGADLCVAKVRCWHEDLRFFTDEYSAMREEFLPDQDVFSYHDMPGYIFNTFHNWPWNKMFRRSFVLEKGLSFQEIRRTNDLYFTCTALINAESITTVKEVLINYRVGIFGNCQSTNTSSPLDFYHAFYKLKEYLVKKGIYGEVKQSFVNHALDGCIANLLSQEQSARQETLYHQLKGGLFKDLDIDDQEEDYFYGFNQRMYRFYRTILEKDYSSFLRLRIQDLKDERDQCLRMNHIDKMGIIERDADERNRLMAESDMFRERMEAAERECIAAKNEREEALEQLYLMKEEVRSVYDSFSYKAGHTVTAPVRACARAARKAIHSDRK